MKKSILLSISIALVLPIMAALAPNQPALAAAAASPTTAIAANTQFTDTQALRTANAIILYIAAAVGLVFIAAVFIREKRRTGHFFTKLSISGLYVYFMSGLLLYVPWYLPLHGAQLFIGYAPLFSSPSPAAAVDFIKLAMSAAGATGLFACALHRLKVRR